MIDPIYTADLTPQQRTWFYAEFQQASKDELVGVLLALFLGGFGAHRFYMRQTGLGILYVIFFWTGIPAIVGFVECFLMPGRVRDFNAVQAQDVLSSMMSAEGRPTPVAAMSLPAQYSAVARLCARCQNAIQAGAAFCAHCGAAA